MPFSIKKFATFTRSHSLSGRKKDKNSSGYSSRDSSDERPNENQNSIQGILTNRGQSSRTRGHSVDSQYHATHAGQSRKVAPMASSRSMDTSDLRRLSVSGPMTMSGPLSPTVQSSIILTPVSNGQYVTSHMHSHRDLNHVTHSGTLPIRWAQKDNGPRSASIDVSTGNRGPIFDQQYQRRTMTLLRQHSLPVSIPTIPQTNGRTISCGDGQVRPDHGRQPVRTMDKQMSLQGPTTQQQKQVQFQRRSATMATGQANPSANLRRQLVRQDTIAGYGTLRCKFHTLKLFYLARHCAFRASWDPFDHACHELRVKEL
ncbi:hypothetical protein HDE_09597 [Halotydeus destructor]|nr:hypothetical protein HDE_09597 [Halotydeus destructor]